MDFIHTAKEVLQTEAAELQQAAERIDPTWNNIIELVSEAEGKLVIMGVGKSGLVGSKMAATLASTGTPSFFIHPTEAMHGDLGMISKGDIVLAISNSGESEELTSILPHIQRFGITIIGMTARSNSTLARHSDHTIDIAISKEACPLGIAPTSSTTLTMALGDALAVSLMQKRGFKKEDFASFHPGGSLGKRLFVKAMDLARTENLPTLDRGATIKDAISVMTDGKLGTVLLMDGKKVTALLSDGDLRRSLMDSDFSLEKPAFAYATKNPKSEIADGLLASDALKSIEESKIQLLILTDTEGNLKGVLHIHTLVEAGIS